MIGKFYPPHAGHHLLISTAAACSDRVTVLVLSHEVESIPHADRLRWLREVHADEAHVTFDGVVDDHPVDFGDPAIWDLHEAVFRGGVAAVTDEPVTAVFSSEPYGDELARRLGAVAVPVDADRGPGAGERHRRAGRPGRRTGSASPRRCGRGSPGGSCSSGAESTGTTTVSAARRRRAPGARRRPRPHAVGPERLRGHRRRQAGRRSGGRRRRRAATPGDGGAGVDARRVRRRWPRGRTTSRTPRRRRGGPVLVCDTDAFAVGRVARALPRRAGAGGRGAGPPPPALPAHRPPRGAVRAGRLSATARRSGRG